MFFVFCSKLLFDFFSSLFVARELEAVTCDENKNKPTWSHSLQVMTYAQTGPDERGKRRQLPRRPLQCTSWWQFICFK